MRISWRVFGARSRSTWGLGRQIERIAIETTPLVVVALGVPDTPRTNAEKTTADAFARV